MVTRTNRVPLRRSGSSRQVAARRSVRRRESAEVHIEAISLVAEVAIGLAGFAGVAVILGRGPGHWGPGDALRIRLLLAAAFSALFASLVATGTQSAGLPPSASVRAGAGALLVGQSYWLLLGTQLRRLEPAQRSLFSARLAVLLALLGGASVIGQLLVLSGLAGMGAQSLFFAGLLASLGYAALGFVRLLFIRPEPE